MTKISVILPIYNTSKYLRQCLDSIVNQTLKDIEIICIDDGSTDNSLDIVKEYTAKDPRVKFLTQPNQGQGVARNKGIDLAEGEYIGFVDTDDWIELNMYQKMYTTAIENNCDLVFCNYERFYEKSKKRAIANKFSEYGINIAPYKVFSWKDLKNKVFENIPYAPWNKIIKKS